MSWETEDGEAAWAEHLAECDACSIALVRGERTPAPGCIDDDPFSDDDLDDDYDEDLAAEYPEWSNWLETRLK